MFKVEAGRLYDLKYGVYRGTELVLSPGQAVVILRTWACMTYVVPVLFGLKAAVWVKRTDLEAAIAG